MPLQQCQTKGKGGWRWGRRGKCFVGTGAKRRAAKQGAAIRASGFTENRTRIVASNPLLADPTRTATLRRIATADVARRYNELKRRIVQLVAVEDAFGLKRVNRNPFRGLSNESGTSVLLDVSGSRRVSNSNGPLHPITLSQEDDNERLEVGDNGFLNNRSVLHTLGSRGMSNPGNTNKLERSVRVGSVLGGAGNGSGRRGSDFRSPPPNVSVTLNQEDENERLETSGNGHPSDCGDGMGYPPDTRKDSSKRGSLPTLNQRWQFLTDPEKVEEFNLWLQTQYPTTVEPPKGDFYYQRYAEEGYEKGAGRAFDDTRKAALASNSGRVSDFYAGTKEEFLRSSFARPVAIDKVKLLTGRVFTDLVGVNAVMASRISRELSEGLVQGRNPRDIARSLIRNVDLSKRQAIQVARTEIIRAHAEGQLDALEALGVTEVGVMVEWSTAGDDRVCPLCEALGNTVMTIKVARGLIPRHTVCRCSFIPANVGESTKGQVRGKQSVQQAIDKSIRREIPIGRDIKGVGRRFKSPVSGRFTVKTKRTLAQQKEITRWVGADKHITKRRPKSVLREIAKKPKAIIPKPTPKPKDRPKLFFAKQQVAWEKSLTASERNAISEYTGDIAFEQVRDCLGKKKGCSKLAKAQIEAMKRALAKAPSRKNALTYRALSFDSNAERVEVIAQFKKAGRVSDKSFMSTSRSRKVVEKFINESGPNPGIVLKVRGSRGVNIANLSEVSEELESLYPPGVKFDVGKIARDPKTNNIVIELKEVT